MKIVELILDELEDFAGFDAVALVNQPAIEAGFHAFNSDVVHEALALQIIKHAMVDEFDLDVTDLPDLETTGSKLEEDYQFESYSDYPKQATENAKIALRYADENGWGDCGTPVGKRRANQLAKGEPISEETIARMAAFARHRENGQKELGDGCGRLIWLAWGGDAGVDWASRKLKQIREESSLSNDKFFDDLSVDKQEKLLERLEQVGYSKEELLNDYTITDEPQKFALPSKSSADPNGPTEQKGAYKILYEYSGPRDSKNRSFCRRLLDLNLLFRKEDIQKMSLQGANSTEFGYYSIFDYKGSFGCRHRWNKKYVYQKKSVGLLEVAALLLDQERQAEKNVKKPQQVSAFNKQYKFATDDDQQIVVGPLMLSNKLILRADDEGNPYYVYFSDETIQKIAYKMMEEKKLDQINIEHDQDTTVSGNMLETWIVQDELKDKQQVYGMNYPKGSWLGMYKIEDPEVWKMIKDGTLTGFSIEGYFADKLIQAKKVNV